MALDLSSELQGRFSCLFLVTLCPVSLAADDITIMAITKGLLWNGFPGWERGHSRALRGSSSHYRLPNRRSISSQPDFFILKKMEMHRITLSSTHKEMILNSGKSLFGDISWALNPAGGLGSEKGMDHLRGNELLGMGAMLDIAQVPVDLELQDPVSTKGCF